MLIRVPIYIYAHKTVRHRSFVYYPLKCISLCRKRDLKPARLNVFYTERVKAIIKNIRKFIPIFTKEFAQRNLYVLKNS